MHEHMLTDAQESPQASCSSAAMIHAMHAVTCCDHLSRHVDIKVIIKIIATSRKISGSQNAIYAGEMPSM